MSLTKNGKMRKFGDVIIAEVQFVDTREIKRRPALVLFEEFDNIICLAITSNPKMIGVPLAKDEGMLRDSVVKLNYIFTISREKVHKFIFSISNEKKSIIKSELIKKLN